MAGKNADISLLFSITPYKQVFFTGKYTLISPPQRNFIIYIK